MSGSSNGEPPKLPPLSKGTSPNAPSDQRSVTESTLVNTSASTDSAQNPKIQDRRTLPSDDAGAGALVNMDSINATEPPATEVTLASTTSEPRDGLLELNESPRHIRVRNMSKSEKGDRSHVRGRLVVVSDLDKDCYVYLDGPLLNLGRGRDADVMVLDEGVSRLHARIIRHDEGFRILDAGSENGTFLNGRSIKEAELYDGDIVGLGQTRLQYEGVGWRRDLLERPSMVRAVFKASEPSSSGAGSIWPNMIVAALTTFLFLALVSALRGPTPIEPKALAQDWYQRAQLSVKEARWRDARDEIEIAKVLGLDESKHRTVLSRVEKEMADEELAHMIRGSIAAGQPLSTIKTLEERVSKGTPRADEIRALVSKEINRRTDRWFRDARRAQIASDIDLATLHVNRILELRPNHKEAEHLKAQLKSANSPKRPAPPKDQKQRQ